MDLTPVTRAEVETGTLFVDSVRRQAIGVRTGPVTRGPMVAQIRTVGRVTYDETRLHDVNMKVRGWIRRLFVATTGQYVQRGAILFTLYGPEVYAAQRELVDAARRYGSGTDARGRSLIATARQRLRLWDIADEELDRIIKDRQPLESIPVRAPASGFVIEKNVVKGAAVMPGMRLYRIAALDRVWIDADAYESDLALVKRGMPAQVKLTYLPGETFEARVAYVYPYLAERSRTSKLRLELANPQGRLRPGMFADVQLEADLGERLRVPSDALVYVGPRRLVFIDLGEGRLQPRIVEVGARAGAYHEVLDGLAAGDIVVTSGNFLIAAESRIRSAAKYWGGSDETQ